MGLTLPGLIGRFFAAASNIFASSSFAGDTWPSLYVFGDGRIYLGDGTEDLTSGTLVYTLPEFYVRARANRIGFVLRSTNMTDPVVRNLLELQDNIGAPIFSVATSGGVFLNDNFGQCYSVITPPNFFTNIYGYMQLTQQSAFRCSAGPAMNIMTWADAVSEVYQRGRVGTAGRWTATNASFASVNVTGPPTGMNAVRQWSSTAAGNIVATTATGTAGYPVPALAFVAAMVFTKSVTVARSKTLGLLFYNAAGTAIGSATVGAAVTDTTTGWTRLDVQAVSPVGAAYCALQLTVTGCAGAAELHQDSAAGIWPGCTTSQVTAWNPPFTFRQDAFMPAAWAVTGCTGNTVTPIVVTVGAGHPFMVGDTVTTTAIGGNTAANQVNAVITAVTATTFTIPGTGNGAYTSGGSAQMIYSAIGQYDGANAGDIAIRADGPSNIVQRFFTNATAGIPSAQRWVGDPRITSQPARINWYGGNYLQQTGSADLDYTLPNVATGMLHNDPPDSVNRGVIATPGQWNLINDASNAQAFGGMANFVQAVRKKSTGAPYVSKDGMFAFMYGLWDMATVSSAGGASQMAQINGTGNTGAIANTLRALICQARASSILPWNDTHFVLTGNSVSGTVQYSWSQGGPGVGGTFTYWPTTTSSTFTFTIPADFTGGAVTILGPGAPGAFGGTFTFTGTLFTTGGVANPGPLYISSTSPVGARARVAIRFKNLTAAHAGLTIIGTTTQVDATGGTAIDCAAIEGQYPNLVAVFGVPRLPANANYASLAGAGSYWNSNSGSSGDADVNQMNAALKALVAEFDSSVFFVDTDAALQKQASFFAADGFSMSALGVHAMASQFVAALQAQLPLIDFRNVNHDYHDTTVVPVGGPWSKSGPLSVSTGVSRFYADDYYYLSSVRASVNTAPVGASIIVDVLKNGSTIFTTTANRPTITAGTNSAISAAPPDLLFVVPGDYLTVNVAQVGTGNPGADLTVNVLGRKIPIP